MNGGRVIWLSKDDPPGNFPPVSAALSEPDGLLAAGGDLGVERLLYAYRHGIFPWYDDGQPLLWWSPDPRCIFAAGDFHCSRSLRRDLRRSDAEIRMNTVFSEVVRNCAAPRRSAQGTWITPAMIAAYEELHAEGWAHSVEVWQSGTLVGGLYGVCIGRAFFGESMFSQRPNMSKLAMLYLANRLTTGELELLDCQLVSAHLLGLGARVIPREDFISRLDLACEPGLAWQDPPCEPVPCRQLSFD